jgi:hypothetical protein
MANAAAERFEKMVAALPGAKLLSLVPCPNIGPDADPETREIHNGQCCCNCRYLIRDFSHPCTDGGRISEQRGWICFPPEFEGVMFSGWNAHGLCEMHGFREEGAEHVGDD